MTTLYIVATPIGNLEDISMRALRILGEVDFVLCEDTRVTQKLLSHYNIKTPTMSFHQHSDDIKIDRILKLFAEGKNLALVTDAGTPGISDPGGKLVQAVIEESNSGKLQEKPVHVESVPGPSAVTAALSISGIPTDKFMFMGFPPHKKGRMSFIERIASSVYPVVIYESKHRIIKFLDELAALNRQILKRNKEIDNELEQGASAERKELSAFKRAPVTSVVVCRELSKLHETVYRGDLDYIIKQIKENKDDQRGEFTVIIGK